MMMGSPILSIPSFLILQPALMPRSIERRGMMNQAEATDKMCPIRGQRKSQAGDILRTHGLRCVGTECAWWRAWRPDEDDGVCAILDIALTFSAEEP